MDKRFHNGQYGQDEIIEKLCYPRGNELHKGIFVEIGAYDGYDLSNTYWLEKCKGWSGLLVEPIPIQADAARHNRWCDVWQGCVYNRDGEVEFTHIKGYSEMLSGIEEGYNAAHKARVNKEIADHKQETVKLKVMCKTINSLLNAFELPKVDILSLDTQTSELAVLQAYDPIKNPIKAILLDFNSSPNRADLEEWFAMNGYKLYWKHQHADEHLFVHPGVKWSWEQ
jgi:FkbM family methyltransferase